MRSLAILLLVVVLQPSSLIAQSRWNNYFVAHFLTSEETSQSTVDSLAEANDWHRTFHAPMIGHTEAIYDYAYATTDVYTPLASLVTEDSTLNTGRLICLGDGNSTVNTPVLEEVIYEPDFSPELSWQYFQYLAVECIDADYYQVKVPSTGSVLEAIEIIKARPSFSSENWYFNIDGYAVTTESCMEFGFNIPSVTSCSSGYSVAAATQATEYMAGFIQNISGVPWFPFVLSMNSGTAGWSWSGCTTNNSYQSTYDLGEMAPSTGCLPLQNEEVEYWSCDTVFVACTDLNFDGCVDVQDIMGHLAAFGAGCTGTPYDCVNQE